MDYRMPIYIQLKESIKEKIKNGEYKPGAHIPSEREFAELYGINRMTAKHAINALVEDGLLYRVRGSGTYVKEQAISRGPVEVGDESSFGLSTSIQLGGRDVKNRILNFKKVKNEELSRLFRDDSFYELARIRYADDSPISMQYAYLPYHMFLDADRMDFAEISLYDYMDLKGKMPVRFMKRLTMVRLEDRIAKWLDMEQGSYAFLVEYYGYTKDERLVEYTKSYFHPNHTQFHYTSSIE